MTLKLFYMPISPPARAVLLTIRNLGLDVELVSLNLFAAENLAPEFLKLNPTHQIPVLVDGDFVLSESRAIMAYLVNSRKPGSDLYPTDPKKRALIDQRLYFDATTVFSRNCAIARQAYFVENPDVTQEQKDAVGDSMTLLDTFLENSSWFAGDKVTIADLTILANVSQAKAMGYNIDKHVNLAKWLKNCETLPGFEENQNGADLHSQNFKKVLPNVKF